MLSPTILVGDLDIHKDSVFTCILNENGDKFEFKYGVLGRFITVDPRAQCKGSSHGKYQYLLASHLVYFR